MATIDGAKAIGLRDQIGSIEVGKKADIVIFDMKHANTTPLNRPHSQIVYCAKSHNVDTVIIDGKIVMQNQKITSINESIIIDKTQSVIDDLLQRSDADGMRRGWTT
jgi:5-methylthioadenosine/S-adenosylhomocysteine deaminase